MKKLRFDTVKRIIKYDGVRNTTFINLYLFDRYYYTNGKGRNLYRYLEQNSSISH
jgi:hypothetical protein